MFGKIHSFASGVGTVGNIQKNWQYVRNCYIFGVCRYIHGSFYTSGIRQKLTSLSCAQWHFKQKFAGIFSTFMGTLGKDLFHQLEFELMEGHDKLVLKCRAKVVKQHEGWVISNTVSTSGAVFHNEITMADAVGNEEIAHVKMSCVLWTQQSAILLKKDGTLVVLMENCFIAVKLLCMKEVVCPK